MSDLENAFPGLAESTYQITSPASPTYNCIAWAAGETGVWWWPDSMSLYYWPPGIPRRETLEAFVGAFGFVGYTPCENGEHHPGMEKVALFVRPDGTPTHAARQLRDGTWTSKLGGDRDISHKTVVDLAPTQARLVGKIV